MFHVFEEPQLPVGPLGEQLRLERPVQLLDRHRGSCPVVHCRAAGKDTREGGETRQQQQKKKKNDDIPPQNIS